jgi:F-type H+-transporting ATPase subunit alpha
MRVGLQTASIYAGTKGFLDNLAVEAVRPFEAAFHQHLSDEHLALVDKLETQPKFDAELEGALRKALTDFKEQYVKDNANVLAA